MAKGKNKATPVDAPYDGDAWRAEDDARTLLRADEIRRDKPRLAKAKAWAKKRADELRAVGGIGNIK